MAAGRQATRCLHQSETHSQLDILSNDYGPPHIDGRREPRIAVAAGAAASTAGERVSRRSDSSINSHAVGAEGA